MRKCRKIGAKAVLGTVGMVVFLAAAICGYGWHCCMVEKDKLLAENNRQKIKTDAYEKKLDFTRALEILRQYAAAYGGTPEIEKEIEFLKSR